MTAARSARAAQAAQAAQRAQQSGRRNLPLFAAGGYLLFIIYGSLLPWDFKPRPLDTAWQNFLDIRYLALGIESRADWIANVVLYMPLAYLLCVGFGTLRRPALAQAVLATIVLLICASLAVSVEFAQLFFPPRTVSMNDVIAEIIGSVLGIGVCLMWGGRLGQLRAEMIHGGTVAIRAVAVVYLLAYLALNLFPYDFYVSAAEFSEKLASDAYGLWLAPAACDRFSLCSIKILAEIIIVMPLGILLSMTRGKAARSPNATAIASGLALGLVLEVLQLFMASGMSQGLSLLTRAAGLSLGVTLHRRARFRWLVNLLPHVTLLIALLCVPYLLALMWLNGWFSGKWGDVEQARASLEILYWIPFYYHYFTTEQAALRSLLFYTALYLPIGLAYWAWTIRRSSTYSNGTAFIPVIIATPIALVLEAGKLFVPGKHADPTDVLIAAFAAGGAYLCATQLQKWSLQGAIAPVPAYAQGHAHPAGSADNSQSMATSPGRLLFALLLLAGVALALLNYPLSRLWALAALGAYAAVIWRYPHVCLPSLLALLPLLNFSPWSGWLLLNEFDLLIAVALAVRLLQPRTDNPHVMLPPGSQWAIGLLAASYVASAITGLLPLTAINQNTLVSYFGGLNSLRIMKGFAWALALLPFALVDTRQAQYADQRLAAGVLTGLCAVLAFALWERAVFSSLMDFSADYRLEGPFPELHTGGGDIDAYLVMVMPLVIWWATLRPTLARLVLGAALFALTSYAVAVTFTRGGYIAYGGAVLILAMAAAAHWLRARTKPVAAAVGIAGIAGVILAGLAVTLLAMLAMGASPFMEARLATTKADAATRTGHWSRAIDMMDSNPTTTLFGMGLGTFPGTLLAKAGDAASATFSYQREAGNGFVRLGTGKPLYLDQRVSAAKAKRLMLSLDLRSVDPKAGISVSLCEKSMQASFACERTQFTVDKPGPAWKRKEIEINTARFESYAWLLQRPMVISLSNAERKGLIEVDNVQLIDEGGRNLIDNGDFSRGGARWFFTTDDHLPWHIFSLWAQILFEQGAFGILAFAIVAGISLSNLMRRTWRGDWFSGSLLASLVGFLLLGFTESLFDGPRVTTVFYLLLFLGLRPALQNTMATGK